ncbi:Septin-9, partial [Nibea albiflora]
GGGDRFIHAPFSPVSSDHQPPPLIHLFHVQPAELRPKLPATPTTPLPDLPPSESSNPRSPKTGMRRIELTGGRNPDTASSRRTEISIEVSSKQIDSSPSAGIARFGLKRPEVSLSSRSTPLDSSSNSISSSSSANRRAELSMTRPSEPPRSSQEDGRPAVLSPDLKDP